MFIVTGGAGFIGSALIWKLNKAGIDDIVVVDDLKTGNKWLNLSKRSIHTIISKNDFPAWLQHRSRTIEAVFHLGACSSTTETDGDYLMRNNCHFSMALFEYCADHQIPFLYASSAATYGLGKNGFDDRVENLSLLHPINKYGYSKHLFDIWCMRQKTTPPSWFGFKFFNVYGPNEYHKGSQASVIYHAFHQIKQKNTLKLFKSYREDFAHGEQKRDFVYVKDVSNVLLHFYYEHKKAKSGIYNLGTGAARSFADLGRSVFQSLGVQKVDFEWIDMPDSLKSQYQYFTEAQVERLKTVGGYRSSFTSLEEGVEDYVKGYLSKEDVYL